MSLAVQNTNNTILYGQTSNQTNTDYSGVSFSDIMKNADVASTSQSQGQTSGGLIHLVEDNSSQSSSSSTTQSHSQSNGGQIHLVNDTNQGSSVINTPITDTKEGISTPVTKNSGIQITGTDSTDEVLPSNFVEPDSKTYKPYYIYVTPEGQVYDVSKEMGDQMIKNAVAQGYDSTVNGRVTVIDKNDVGNVEINDVEYKKRADSRYDTVSQNSTLAIKNNPAPTATAVTGIKDNTQIFVGAGSQKQANEFIAQMKKNNVTNYIIEVVPSDVETKIERVTDYYLSNKFNIQQMIQNYNPFKYDVLPFAFQSISGDSYATSK